MLSTIGLEVYTVSAGGDGCSFDLQMESLEIFVYRGAVSGNKMLSRKVSKQTRVTS